MKKYDNKQVLRIFVLAVFGLVLLSGSFQFASAEDLSSFNVRQILVRADQNYDAKLDQMDIDVINSFWESQQYDVRADVNKDGVVNVADRSIVNSWWRNNDFNEDGFVSILDYLENMPYSDIVSFGDVNEDGALDESDVDYVNNLWVNQEYEEKADLVYDLVINVGDRSFVNYLVENYGPSVECSETDGGRDFFTKGAITGVLIYDGQSRVANDLEDVCTLDGGLIGSCEAGEECKIAEYYCENGWAKIDQYQCPKGCNVGACVGQHLCSACVDGTPTGEYDSFGCMIYKCPNGDNQLKRITIRGRLVNQLTEQPVAGAKLISAYEFSPTEVVTDKNGGFEFEVDTSFILKEGPEAGQSNRGGQWDFDADCYEYVTISMMNNQEIWRDGKLVVTYPLAVTKHEFDSEEIIQEVTSDAIDLGDLRIYPAATLFTQTDIESTLEIFYKMKNSEGYNGPGQMGHSTSHSLNKAIPLGYEVHLVFTGKNGREYETSEYAVPTEPECGIVTLAYKNGKSQWSFGAMVEPTESTGPIELPILGVEDESELISELCNGCALENKCYPMGYRKGGEYCSEEGLFVGQISAESSCENNFECESNLCIDSKCVSGSAWQKFLSWFKRIFG